MTGWWSLCEAISMSVWNWQSDIHHDSTPWLASYVGERKAPQCLNVSIKLSFFCSWQFFPTLHANNQVQHGDGLPRAAAGIYSLFFSYLYDIAYMSGSLCHLWLFTVPSRLMKLFRGNQINAFLFEFGSSQTDKITMIMSSEMYGHRFFTKTRDVPCERCGVFPVRVGWKGGVIQLSW